LEQLNKIPGYNLIWNIAHIIVVQQMLGFTNIRIPMISGKMVGTKPEHIVTQAEVDEIQTLLMETINQTETI
jgi:hypothetical protein